MSAAAESAGAAARVARGQQRVEAEAGHQDGQQGEAEPPLAELAVRVITGTNVVICNQSDVRYHNSVDTYLFINIIFLK